MRRVLLLALFLGLLLPVGAVHGDDGVPGGTLLDAGTRDFDQLHLDLHVTPDLERGTVEGRATLSFEALVDGLRRLRLHSEDTRVLAVVGEEGEALAFTQAKGVLTIDLTGSLGRGQGSSVTVTYRSTPRRGLYFHRPTKRHPETPLFMYSQGQANDNRRWIPCYDLPDDRFAWDIRVTVQDDFETVSNGVLAGSEDLDDGRRRDHWCFEDRSPSYLVSLIVADLEIIRTTWGDVALEYGAVPGHVEELHTALGDTPNMLEFYSTYLDAPYPWTRYAQTFVWDFVYGGMENITATTLNMRALHRPAARPNYTSDGLVAHELAHMWFGDLITCRTWNGIWLNEGFATYLTDLYVEHRDGRDAFLLRRRNQNRSYMDGTPNPGDLGLVRDARGDRPLELFGGKEYNRGAAILHMLRLELGDEGFRNAIRTYVKRFRDRTVTSEDLRLAVETAAGRDLRWFWDQWVYGAGYPVLAVTWEPSRRRLIVHQVQARKGGQGLFRLTLPVRCGPTGEVRRLRVWRDHHVFQFPEEKRAPYLRVGVGGDLLARIRFSQGPAAWAAALRLDPDVTCRLDALEALDEHGPAAVPALAAALASDDSWAVRAKAAEGLGHMDADADAGKALRAARADADPRVRESVFEALGTRTRVEVEAVLLAAAQEETHDYPRAAAARSLGRVKAKGAWDVLLALLGVDSHGDVVRAGALEGLRNLGDPRAAGVARSFCDYRWGKGGAQRMRQTALDCATSLAPDAPETHALLVDLLLDPHHAMRKRVAKACGTYGVRQAHARLQALAKNDGSGGVRAAAKHALEELRGRR